MATGVCIYIKSRKPIPNGYYNLIISLVPFPTIRNNVCKQLFRSCLTVLEVSTEHANP